MNGLFSKIRAFFFSKFSESRKYPRVPISVKVTNVKSGTFTYYQATNISLGGMFLRADSPLPLKTLLKLRFSLPEKENIEVDSEVVRVQHGGKYPSGMGLMFTELDQPDRDAIRSFVNKKL